MKKFTHIEDYIEVISGYRDPVTNKTQAAQSLWFSFNPIISLARYDVSVLENMCDAVIAGKALTQRQGELAIKIIKKYQRQLAQKDIDIESVEVPMWRNPLRIMDYTKKMYIENDSIMIEFPFNDKLVDGLREFRKNSQGKGEWDKEKRRWGFALTEYNLSYLITWTEANGFEIDDASRRLNNLITEVEQNEFSIELAVENAKCVIKNASTSLNEYIEAKCGGFGIDNLAKLIDMASVLGYTIHESIKIAWQEQHGALPLFLSLNTSSKLPQDQLELIESVLDYADQTERWPVVIYEPDLVGKMLKHIYSYRDESSVYVTRGKSSLDLDSVKNFKYIHTTVPLKNIKIPLLVSTIGMLFGGDKSLMIQHSEKRVFFVPEVHLGNTKSKNEIPLFGDNNNEQKESEVT